MPTASPSRLRTAIVGCGKVATHARSCLSGVTKLGIGGRLRRGPRASARVCRQLQDQRLHEPRGNVAARESRRVSRYAHSTRSTLLLSRSRLLPAVHVISEKPLAIDLASCDRAIAAARAAGVKLGVISQRRWYEPVQRMKNAIDAGKLGKPVLAMVTMLGWREPAYYKSDPWRGTWKGEGGGVVVSQAPHYLDLLIWLMGPGVEMHGYWDNYNHPGIEVDDTVVASVRFKSGGMASIVLSNSQRPGLYGKIHIHGSSGASVGAEIDSGSPFISGVTEKMDPPFNDIWTVPGEEHNLEAWNREDRSRPCNVMTYYHQLQLADFLAAVSDGREPLVDGEAGRRVVELFTGVYRSQAEHASMKLPLLK